MLSKLRDILTVHRAWEKAHVDAGVPNNHAPQFFDILRRYDEPHRFYHTLAHIAACLRFLDRTYDLHPQKRAALCMALIYHDVIYDVKSKTNEADSAAHARVQLAVMGFAKTYIDEVSRLIMLTANHKGDSADRIGSIMIDTDMHVFAEPDRVYAKYAADIRKEYEPAFGREAYMAGRRQFLSTVDPEAIFVTPEMANEKSASQASWNVTEEFRKLT